MSSGTFSTCTDWKSTWSSNYPPSLVSCCVLIGVKLILIKSMAILILIKSMVKLILIKSLIGVKLTLIRSARKWKTAAKKMARRAGGPL
jgi:hypothetical protein